MAQKYVEIQVHDIIWDRVIHGSSYLISSKPENVFPRLSCPKNAVYAFMKRLPHSLIRCQSLM